MLEEYTSLPDWNGLAMQEQLLHVMQAPHTAGRYRQRLLKQLVALLQAERDVEVHEELLALYIGGMHADARVGWSYRTFEPAGCASLLLRTRDELGGGSETGGMVWDAARALSAWLLVQSPSEYAGLRALELGAGPGLVGLALAQWSEATLCLTDAFPDTLANLEHNAAQLGAGARSRACVRRLDWLEVEACGVGALPDDAAPQLVLAADVIYEPALARPLLATIRTLLGRTRGARALVAAEQRGDAWPNFLAELGRSGLSSTDRSGEARAALGDAACAFYVPAATIERISLLEIRAEADGPGSRHEPEGGAGL